MKTTIKLIFFLVLATIFSCQKESLDHLSEDIDANEKETALKVDLQAKKKTLTAKEWSNRAALDPRYDHTTLEFDDKMWILGGKGNSEIPKNDVRYSYNGINWYHTTPKADFPARFGHASAVFQGKIWVVGGKKYDPTDHDEKWDPEHDHEVQDDEYSELNDVWSSTDGVTWQLVTSNADFDPRNGHTLTTFAGSLWLIGGTSNDQSAAICCGFRDVWKSSNGADWEKVTDYAPFNLRSSHATLAFNETLIVLGGDIKNGYGELWYSIDGVSWQKALENPPFGSRNGHSLIHDGELLWLIAGRSDQNPPYGLENDLWYSKNGLDWFEAGTTKDFPERSNHTSLFFNNKIWVINGRGIPKKGKVDYTTLSDIWSLEAPGCCEIDDITLGVSKK